MSLQRSDLSRSKELMKYFKQTSVWSLSKKMVFPVSDIVVFPLSSNESVFGTITSSEEKAGHVACFKQSEFMSRDLRGREGP